MKVGDLVIVKRMEHQPLNPGIVIEVGKDTTSIQGPNFVSVLFVNTGRVSRYAPSRLKKVP